MNEAQIQSLIKELIEKTGVAMTKITVTKDDSINTWFSVEVNEPHFFLGRDGEALYALNHLIRRIVENNSLAKEEPILIDIDGFQKKRVENIRAVAHMMSERARYFKSSIEVDPMSAFERRIVHEFLSDAADLETESVGFGRTRRVVIKYIGGV